jgi:hypothetical protein
MADQTVLPPKKPPTRKRGGEGDPPKCAHCGKVYLTLDDLTGFRFPEGMTIVEKLSSKEFQVNTRRVVSNADGKNYHTYCYRMKLAERLRKLLFGQLDKGK